MKICPRCRKTYTDDNLNFCLDDGSVLEQAGSSPMPDTVLLNQPRPTAPTQPIPNQQFSTQQSPQPGWNTGQPQYSMQPKKSSKTWVWVVLILGFVALVCGGGLVAFLFWAASLPDPVASNSTANTSSGNKGSTSSSPSKTSSTNSSSTTTTSSSNDDRKNVQKIDLSDWIVKDDLNALTEMDGSDFILATRLKGYYYVVAAPRDTCLTEMADTSVTLRNVDSADSRLGYGIVFHSNPRPLQQGYAFLIDTKKQKYRVVHHSPQKEDIVVSWTRSDAIKSGSQENTLEVRDLSDKIELYINGDMVTSIKNVYGYPGGVVGLYSGDAVKIGFKNLEIRK
jgi:hypothetical protein